MTKEKMLVTMSFEVSYPKWPDAVAVRDSGSNISTISVGALSDDEVDGLCESLRSHCHARREGILKMDGKVVPNHDGISR